MPFKSEAQRKYLWANEPEIARDWTDTYGSRIQKSNGGISQLVKRGPGRPGYAGPAGGASAGGNYGGNVNPDQEYAGRSFKETYGGDGPQGDGPQGSPFILNPPLKGPPVGDHHPDLPPPRKDFGPYKQGNYYEPKGWYDKFRDKSYQFGIDRHKVNALKNMGAFGKPGFKGFVTEFVSGMGPVPDWTEGWTEKELVDALTTGPYLSQQKTKAAVNKFASGKDELSRVFQAQNLLDTGQMTQSEYNDLFPNSTLNPVQKDGLEEWQRLGFPSYEAYLSAMRGVGSGSGEEEVEEKTFDYRFGDTQNVGADVTRGSYIFNQGGRVPRAFGGIMDTATGRRAYGLGSIFKSVGKAVSGVAKAAGKVLKSPFGKAAILGLGGYYLGGGSALGGARMFGNTGFGSTGFGALAKSLGQKALLKGGTGPFELGNISPMKAIGLASVALPFLAGKAEPNEDIGMSDRGGRLLDSQGNEALPADLRAEVKAAYESGDPDKIKAIQDYYSFLPGANAVRLPDITPYLPYPNYATGGRVAAQEGGLMDLGGMEKDYRNEGGFVPIGKEEKADDVPARLSVNEFVFTADAVRNAGGGDIDKGAEVMENMMKNLENGGKVSEESQGNTGAQEMFSVSERIGEVI